MSKLEPTEDVITGLAWLLYNSSEARTEENWRNVVRSLIWPTVAPVVLEEAAKVCDETREREMAYPGVPGHPLAIGAEHRAVAALGLAERIRSLKGTP